MTTVLQEERVLARHLLEAPPEFLPAADVRDRYHETAIQQAD